MISQQWTGRDGHTYRVRESNRRPGVWMLLVREAEGVWCWRGDYSSAEAARAATSAAGKTNG